MAKSKIFKDKIGLYTICGSYISRPFFGTIFQEGDDVNTHHFGGSTVAGVTSQGKPETHNFKKTGQYEIWTTTGMSNKEYKENKFRPGFEGLFGAYSNFEEYLVLQTDWYRSSVIFASKIYQLENSKFAK
jgi:hypothetical protein